ncbi:MAG: hypothetical protein FWD68_19025 [Alphaproteobacteria bacterium]|nr:hypothetical protein [Alphaproteobacteria bacterium]
MNVVAKLPNLEKAEQTIRALARRHGITAARTPIDDWADALSRLSDAEVESDEVKDLLVNLRRAGIVDGATSRKLLVAYLKQARA